MCIRDRLNLLSEWGLPVNSQNDSVLGIKECIDYFKKIEHDRDQLPYEIDGVVLKVNTFKQQLDIGNIARAPRWAIARKFPAEIGISSIESISFQVGRVGSITPVAELKPVKVGGVVISNASLHNFDEIQRLDVRVGDEVVIKRAGDVIPQITEVKLKKKTNRGPRVKPPTACPSCGNALTREEGESVLRCTSSDVCPAQRIENINLSNDQIVKICDRKFIGCDQLIFVKEHTDKDAELEFDWKKTTEQLHIQLMKLKGLRNDKT